MIRLIAIFLGFALVGVATYFLIKSHGDLLIKWKHVFEEYEETDGEMFQDEGKLKDFVTLFGFTMIPALADIFIFGMVYYIIKGLVT